MKVYIKQGRLNYKDAKLVSPLEKVLNEKMAKDSSFTFTPAKNHTELLELYNEHCVEDADFKEVKGDDIESEVESKKDEDVTDTSTDDEMNSVTDPYNYAEPIQKDYSASDDFMQFEVADEKKTFFDEPKSFEESFEMPSIDDEKQNESINTKSNNTQQQPKKEQSQKQAPINPSFDDMSGAKKKRSTKKFAKLIVDGACMLAEKGCIWWTTKDITEDKLIEYKLNNTMELDILLTLENNQQEPVINWFRQKVKDADTIFKIDDLEKQDLIDSLFEVMLEKGVAPTPMQELIINTVKTFVLDMGLKAVQFNASIKSVMNQLIEMKQNETNINTQKREEPIKNDLQDTKEDINDDYISDVDFKETTEIAIRD